MIWKLLGILEMPQKIYFWDNKEEKKKIMSPKHLILIF
jgi:hypothetical protein